MKLVFPYVVKNQPAVSKELSDIIFKLKDQLKKEFGFDYSFAVAGKGYTIACSNYLQGELDPKSTEETPKEA